MTDIEAINAELNAITSECRKYDYAHFSVVHKHCITILKLLKERDALEPEVGGSISFEEIKDIVKETIDEAKNLNNLIETVCKRIYFRGVRDGEIKIHKILTKDQ